MVYDDTGKVVGWDHDLTVTNNADGDAVVTDYGRDASITLEGVAASDFDLLSVV